ncbi:MAG TPA: hypothetical protein VFQ35_18530 [Polyangiaceae bacterium]|nr:hypothetical protein [Polyangiaceae bacterium]
MLRTALTLGFSVFVASSARAATLPDHRPLDVIVISDEVNPNRLTDAELTQPGDISAALNAPDSGLHLVGAGAQEIDSQCADKALERLASDPGPDVVVYFAHRSARSCAGADVQATLTNRIEALLVRGGGFVVFHHGVYQATGKERILELIGAQANSISWSTTEGQRVINVAPQHFVTTNGIAYSEKTTLSAFAGVNAGTYDSFVNVPDERYPQTTLSDVAGATRTVLFASNSGGNRVLSFALSRPTWKGRVVTYQPGEYQPNALDNRRGSNFQILANAILFSAGRVDEAGNSTDASSSGGAPSAGGQAAGASAGGTATAGASWGGASAGSAQGGTSAGSEPGGRGGDGRGGASTSGAGGTNQASSGAPSTGQSGAEASVGGGGSASASGGRAEVPATEGSSSGCSVLPSRGEGSRVGAIVVASLVLGAFARRRRCHGSSRDRR